MKFALSDKDFASIKFGTPKIKKYFELTKFGKDEYTLLEHNGDNVYELCTFTKDELKRLWIALSL